MTSRGDVEERLLENLYLNVPGPEIDRVRSQITSSMAVPFEDIAPDTFVIGVGDENHFLCFAASWEATEDLLAQPEVVKLLGTRTGNELSSMATIAHRRHYMSGQSSDESTELEMLCGIMLQLARKEKPGTSHDSSRRLILLNLSYRKIKGGTGILFTSLWKKRPGLSRG